MKLFSNRIIKNASWIIGLQIIKSILGVVISMLTARYLGPSNYGLINYASSIVAFIVPVMQLGFTNVMVQEFTYFPDQEGKILGTSMCLSVICSVFCIFGVIGFAMIANSEEPVTITVCALYSIMLFFQALELMQYWFQAKLLSKYASIASFIAYIVVTAYRVFLLVSGKDVVWFALSSSIDYLFIAVILYVMYRKLGGAKLEFSKNVAKRMFNKSKHYIFSSLMITIFVQTDKIMIKNMLGDKETGFYSAATTCAGMTGFVFGAIIDSMRSTIFESKKESDDQYEKNIKRLYCVIIYLSILQSLFMTLLASPIIKILYGDDYGKSVNALKIVVWYTTFSYLGSVRNVWILGENKQKYLWLINTLGAGANIGLNFIFIPLMGINGAALASLITQVFTNIIVNWIIWPIKHNNTLMLKSLNPKWIFELFKKEKEDEGKL